ncbi:MAG: hypothetical protein R8G34_15465 [Paracoccaceae bacterium]|nr:hypothetical protein [Paracoccaceae bacterium]
MAIIQRIVRQHVEEAAHLWRRRTRESDSAIYGTEDLARMDGRLMAHIAGLRAAGVEGWPIALQQFEDYVEPGEAFVLFLLALILDDSEKLVWARTLVFAEPPEVQAGAAGALAWCGPDVLRRHLDTWVYDPSADLNYLALAALLAYRTNPGDRLARLQDHPDPRVAIGAATLIGAMGLVDLAPRLARRCDGENAEVAFANLIAHARLTGDQSSLDALLKTETHIDLALILSEPVEARAWIEERLADESTRSDALARLGLLGDPATASVLFNAMEEPALSAAAGIAFRDLLPLDFNDWSVFTLDAAAMPEGFEGRDDGPWPIPHEARRLWDRVQTGEVVADYTSQRRAKHAAFAAGRVDRTSILARWDAPAPGPAWS